MGEWESFFTQIWTGEKVLGVAYKQARVSGEWVQSTLYFPDQPPVWLPGSPSFPPLRGEWQCPKASDILTKVFSLCWAPKVVSRWAWQQLGSPDAVFPWRGTYSSLEAPCCCPLWAVRLTPLAGGHPSSAARMWQRGAQEAQRPCWHGGLLPGQLAAPSARLPPGLFEQLEHPTGLQSGCHSHLILCSPLKILL